MFFENTLLDLVARGFALAAMGIFWVVVLIRLNGLRSLSKMTNFDFVMTIALGSLLATAAGADSWQVFGHSLAAQAALFFVQWGTAKLRRSSDAIETAMQNAPVFLMRDGEFCEDALDETRVGPARGDAGQRAPDRERPAILICVRVRRCAYPATAPALRRR